MQYNNESRCVNLVYIVTSVLCTDTCTEYICGEWLGLLFVLLLIGFFETGVSYILAHSIIIIEVRVKKKKKKQKEKFTGQESAKS